MRRAAVWLERALLAFVVATSCLVGVLLLVLVVALALIGAD